MTDLQELFAPLQDEYYPGSKRKRRESLEAKHERQVEERRVAKEEETWDAHPVKDLWIKGVPFEAFRIGALAKALNRDSVTIRSWMRKGWLPRNSYQTPPIVGSRGNASRRLWTRTQIEGIVTIATEEGLLGEKPPRLVETNFTARVTAAWRSWR